MKTVTFDPTKWQLVPVEPTQKMLNSAWDNMVYRTEILASYQAMLSAAPEHPEAELLTDGCIDALFQDCDDYVEFARAIEKRIKEGSDV